MKSLIYSADIRLTIDKLAAFQMEAQWSVPAATSAISDSLQAVLACSKPEADRLLCRYFSDPAADYHW